MVGTVERHSGAIETRHFLSYSNNVPYAYVFSLSLLLTLVTRLEVITSCSRCLFAAIFFSLIGFIFLLPTHLLSSQNAYNARIVRRFIFLYNRTDSSKETMICQKSTLLFSHNRLPKEKIRIRDSTDSGQSPTHLLLHQSSTKTPSLLLDPHLQPNTIIRLGRRRRIRPILAPPIRLNLLEIAPLLPMTPWARA